VIDARAAKAASRSRACATMTGCPVHAADLEPAGREQFQMRAVPQPSRARTHLAVRGEHVAQLAASAGIVLVVMPGSYHAACSGPKSLFV